MTAFVMLVPGPVMPSWLVLGSLLAVMMVFASQPIIRSRRMVIVGVLAILVAIMGCARVRTMQSAHPAFAYSPAACKQDQSDWGWWLLCKAEAF